MMIKAKMNEDLLKDYRNWNCKMTADQIIQKKQELEKLLIETDKKTDTFKEIEFLIRFWEEI
jgi:hypothetical protein